jgi:AAA+ superfamily predicted ATPase
VLTEARAPDLGLIVALRRLDALLVDAVTRAAATYGPDAATDPYRGLVIGPDEVARLLDRAPGEPFLAAQDADPIAADPGRELVWLGRAFGLTAFDIDVLLVAIAPELDLRYERLFGYLQDDVTRRRPSVDVALNLLCHSARERLEARARFAPDGPLLAHGLIELLDDPNQPRQPLLARAMKPDEQIVRFVIGESTLDPRLVSCAHIERAPVDLAALLLEPDTLRSLPSGIASQARTPPPRLAFHGPRDSGQYPTAVALASAAGMPLLAVDLEQASEAGASVEAVVTIAFREARLHGYAIFLTGLERVCAEPRPPAHDRVVAEIANSAVPTIVDTRDLWAPVAGALECPPGLITVPFPTPSRATRRACWEQALGAVGLDLGTDVVTALADHYRLDAPTIAEATHGVHNRAVWTGTDATAADLFAAARAHSGSQLGALARKVRPTYRWDDLILPSEGLAQLRDIRDRVGRRRQVLGEWGFERTLALNQGVCALFAGASGTGKTMAAEIISGELGLDLYTIDLATVVSKYIGETEKNLARIFGAAETANAVLFFDEADALFGKRSEVRDAHDRYANIEIAYLLQRMEQYDGVAILATNLRQNVDNAFLRRLQFIVEFPMPDQEHRARMWREFLPREAPVDTIDFEFLAREFRLSGGNIRNIVVSAAYLASANGGRIGMSHLMRAAWREHQKIGRVFAPNDAGDYAAALPEAE